jgi:hypothetical protein
MQRIIITLYTECNIIEEYGLILFNSNLIEVTLHLICVRKRSDNPAESGHIAIYLF